MSRLNQLSILFVLLAVLCCSCSSVDKRESDFNKKEFVFSTKILQARDEFSKIEFVPLQTTEENIVRYVSQVVKKQDKYIVFSGYPDDCIAIHDSLGQLINVIRQPGKGPEDLSYAMAVHVDSLIHVYSRLQYIRSYDLEGNFRGSTDGVGWFCDFIKDKDKLVLYDFNETVSYYRNMPLNNRFNVFQIDSFVEKKLLFSDFKKQPHRQKYMGRVLPNNMFLKGSELYYWNFPADTIYTLNLNNLKRKTHAILDMGKWQITQEFIDQPWEDARDFGIAYRKKGLFSLNDYYPLKKDVYCFGAKGFSIEEQGSRKIDRYNSIQLFSSLGCKPFKFAENIRVVGSIDDDQLIFTIQSEEFLRYCKKIKSNASPKDWGRVVVSYEGLSRTLETVTEESNPVLMVATLK